MSTLIKPFATTLDLASGVMTPKGKHVTRRLSDMAEMYNDQGAVQELIRENPLIYEVFNVELPENEEHVQHCTTVLYPGKVGDEYFMTKGHYHKKINRAEVYVCLKGQGMLIMQTKEGDFDAIEMVPGTVAYVAPQWAHRTVNTGDEPFVFFAAYPGDAGHDYGGIEREGFVKLVVERGGKPLLVDNPRYRRR